MKNQGMIKKQISKDLKRALKELSLDEMEPFLEHPAQENHGDFSTNIAMILWGKKKKSEWKSRNFQKPLDLAEEIAGCYRGLKSASYLEKIETAPPGFINLWLSKKFLTDQVSQIIKEKKNFGTAKKKQKEAVMVEFAHPNTHKAFHLGHLRNIISGEAIVRALEALGIKVYRTNYQGDIGLHVAKCLWGIRGVLEKKSQKVTDLKNLDEQIKLLSEAYVLGSREYNDSPDVRKEIEVLNQKIYHQDPEIKDLWHKTREWSLVYFERIYRRVSTKFDKLYFESEMAGPGKKLALKYLGKGVLEQSEGAIIFPGKKYGLHNRVFLTKQDLPTYEAKDLALSKREFSDFPIELCLHVVGPEQKGYFEVLFKALELVQPQTAGRQHHLVYGWVNLKTGKMSSRSGEVVLGEWLLDEVKKKLRSRYQMTNEAAEAVTLGAVKYSFLKINLLQSIAFDIDESISLEGNSGPYLQYTHARTQSVLKKNSGEFSVGFPSKLSPEEMALLRTLYKFPETVIETAEDYSPSLLCSYLFDLAQKFNLFYQKQPILKAEQGQREFRLSLTQAVGQVIKNGLFLLGISAPEKM